MPRSSTVAGVTPRVASRRSRHGPLWARQLLTKPRGRDFVGAENRLAVPLALRVLVSVLWFGHGHARARGNLPDGLRKRNLVVQFDELEDVALGAAPEAMEEPLIAVDVERRRFLSMKRTEPLPRGPAAAQRHPFLDDLHDVGVRLEVLDEVGRKKRHYSLNSTTVTPPPPCSGGAD